MLTALGNQQTTCMISVVSGQFNINNCPRAAQDWSGVHELIIMRLASENTIEYTHKIRIIRRLLTGHAQEKGLG